LFIDGGGIRGLSSLQVLWNLMREIQLSEHLEKMPLPCECFDLIGGTSTGGIIALMLGRLRMSVDDALHKYAQLSKDVFSDEKFLGDGAFKASNLEAAIKKVISAQPAAMHDSEARMRDDAPSGGLCRTFVCVTAPVALGSPTPTLFRTYEPRHERFINCKIWEAARATSAAPTFFKPIEIDNGFGILSRYTDGGIGHNNPAGVVLHEASSIFPERKIACMISIGTGKLKVSRLDRPGFIQRIMPRIDVAVAIVKIVTDCETVAEDMEHRFHDSPGVYFRFNVDQGMDGVKLSDWDKLDVVHDVTEMYLRSTTVSKTMTDAAAAVRARRGVAPTVQASMFCSLYFLKFHLTHSGNRWCASEGCCSFEACCDPQTLPSFNTVFHGERLHSLENDSILLWKVRAASYICGSRPGRQW
ncbi:FabD/lysophospholipase-like protein, partial [Stereum hirsutum FP-91666 SS1]|uniref:FabD/lysophospholipase-like protein n=1 Tax=Stereum hirsutum (strain FP-91666) TaxID=721885 RepID=UPI000440A474